MHYHILQGKSFTPSTRMSRSVERAARLSSHFFLLLVSLYLHLLFDLLLLDQKKLDFGELFERCGHERGGDLVLIGCLHDSLVILVERLELFCLVAPLWKIFLSLRIFPTGEILEGLRFGQPVLHLALALQLRDEPRCLSKKLLVCVLPFRAVYSKC